MGNMLEDYEINSETLAILPYKTDSSEVLESDCHYYVKKTPKEILDNSCRFYGSSLEGRLSGTKRITGFHYKSPIIVEESYPTIFFPTESPHLESCSWINLKNIKSYLPYFKGSIIEFKNGQTLALNISKHSLENQVFRASRLSQQLNERKIAQK